MTRSEMKLSSLVLDAAITYQGYQHERPSEELVGQFVEEITRLQQKYQPAHEPSSLVRVNTGCPALTIYTDSDGILQFPAPHLEIYGDIQWCKGRYIGFWLFPTKEEYLSYKREYGLCSHSHQLIASSEIIYHSIGAPLSRHQVPTDLSQCPDAQPVTTLAKFRPAVTTKIVQYRTYITSIALENWLALLRNIS